MTFFIWKRGKEERKGKMRGDERKAGDVRKDGERKLTQRD